MEELFERHAEKLFAYLRQHTTSREDAEDILAETFMAALAEAQFLHFSETAQVAWLWRVARNKVADAFRKAAFRRHVPLEQVAESVYEDEAQMALRQDEADEIYLLLRSLSESQQEMLRLRFGYDLRCSEIAAIQGKREDAVRAMLSRTLNFLRRSYKPRSSITQSRQPGKQD